MKTIREIKEELQAASGMEREKLLELYREDTRSGVVSLVKKYDREKELLEKEKQRIEDMKVYENTYSHVGWICGIDEAGRRPAGGACCGRCGDLAGRQQDPLAERLQAAVSKEKRKTL